jgi:hypothetical protein
MRSATGAHNQELVDAPDQGAGSSGPPETESLAVGRPLGSIQHLFLPLIRMAVTVMKFARCLPPFATWKKIHMHTEIVPFHHVKYVQGLRKIKLTISLWMRICRKW